MLQHLLGNGEVGNDAILHRTNGRDITRRTPQHTFGVGPYGGHAAHIACLANGHYRRLIEHDTATANINQRIGRSQINGKIAGKQPSQTFEHGCRYLVQCGTCAEANGIIATLVRQATRQLPRNGKSARRASDMVPFPAVPFVYSCTDSLFCALTIRARTFSSWRLNMQTCSEPRTWPGSG